MTAPNFLPRSAAILVSSNTEEPVEWSYGELLDYIRQLTWDVDEKQPWRKDLLAFQLVQQLIMEGVLEFHGKSFSLVWV